MCEIFLQMHGLKLLVNEVNEKMEDIVKIVKSLEKSSLLIKASETIKNEAKEQKGGFFGMLLGALAANLYENLLASE